MKITRACDYTIRTLIYMAKSPMDNVFMRSDLAKACNVPDSFLGKILQSLAKSEFLISERGKKGGFKLAKKPSDINMLEIMNAVDGDLNINICVNDAKKCGFSQNCKAHEMWIDVQNVFANQLSKYSLADLVNNDVA